MQKLTECKISDQFKFKRGLQRLKDHQNEALAALEIAIIESADEVLKKQNLDITLTYPDLPISNRREEIAKAINDNQVIVLAGETGSGKTTQLPKICLDLGLGCKGLIGHTQPRRLAARTVADRIAQELGTTLGERVGYQVRFYDQLSESTQIKLMTDGILLAETQNDRLLEKYEVLIIDEAHERSLNIDFLLGYISQILPKRPDLKLIITSATIDLERFSKHFNNAPIIEVSGRTYPVDILYRPLETVAEDSNKVVDIYQGVLSAIEEITQIERQGSNLSSGDILVFISGEREIRETAEVLRKSELKHVDILPLYARLSVSEQQRIFSQNVTTKRRIIISTNVAETSVTVPGIRYVIDTGVARISRYSYRSKVQRLPIESISQASANQRAGRCGRISAGTCIRLYSQQDFDSRAEFTDAEIRRTNLAAVILQMLNLKLGSISHFPFIDPPDSRFINDGFKLLEELRAVSPQRAMTPLGRQIAKLPVDPRIGRMIIEANEQGALKEVLIIASALSVQDPKERPLNKQQAADLAHKTYQDEDSDFVGFVNLWNAYEKNRQSLSSNQLKKFCSQNFLSFMRMREWRDVHRQLTIACKTLGYKAQTQVASYQSVHVSLLSGLLGHIGFKQENKEFLGARNRCFYIFPASVQYKKPAKWIMVSELVETSKLFGRVAAKIDPQWVEPLAPHLIKKSYSEPKWQKKRAQVTAYEQVVLYGLSVVQKRVVNFGSIEGEQSQEIFIRSALVEGDYHTHAAFFKHNQNLLDGVEHLEAKSRRKDLLIDEQALYDFYASKISALSDQLLVNGAMFEKWRKRIEAQQPKILFLQESDVLQRSCEHINAFDYPNEIEYRGISLKLSYHFNPASIDDGVSLHLPVALLKQLPKERLNWLVPGLIKERCIALLKSLPKARRKHFVPIPDYINAFIESMHFAEGDLFEQLSHHLLRMTGVKLQPEEFSNTSLADHLYFNIKLLDNDAQLIEQSRDIEHLRRQHFELVDSHLLTEKEHVWGEVGLTSWSFDELPESVEIKQGGVYVTAWPALQRSADKVDLILTMNKEYSQRLSREAITYLASELLAVQLKKMPRSIPKLTESVLFSGKKFTKKSLENELNSLAVRELLQLEQSLPSNRSEFLQRIQKVVKEDNYRGWIERVAEKVFLLHRDYYQLQKQLNSQQQLITINIVADIKQQLERLFSKSYLSHISWYRLEQYTRYMKSVEARLEKYQRELPRQKMLTLQLAELEERLYKRLDTCRELNEVNPDLENYRWLLEEYRISLFSQQIKTLESVSEKRMRQKWQAVSYQ